MCWALFWVLGIQQETEQTYVKITPGKGHNRCKGPEADLCLARWRNREAGTECRQGCRCERWGQGSQQGVSRVESGGNERTSCDLKGGRPRCAEDVG